ncbi:glycosyltransferase family 2 protein [Kribbia dieselivorans]|uniref:glycosyltransferase family 2 protein n=1 Tax=Kribbia dieselivorans TaxID=331526 RepID=UPI0009F9E1F7|nr:glycosyltransferase family 2 protein [Kribbia dieselivorans]
MTMGVQWPRWGERPATVTVVIPCYNYGHFLPEAVASVLEQPGVEVDVIIVDDASTDDSADVAHRLAAADPRVRVLVNERNLRHIRTYNRGLREATGEFVMLLSSDDVLTPGALARAVNLMVANPRVGFVYGHPVSFEETPPRAGRGPFTWTVVRGRQWRALTCWRGRNFILSPEVVMRTAALRDVGYFNEAAPHAGDLELWLRLSLDWDVGRVNGRSAAFYRVHADNMHVTTFDVLNSMVVDLEHRRAAFGVLVGPDPAGLRRARRGLAREAMLLAQRGLDAGGTTEAAVRLTEFAKETWPEATSDRRYAGIRRRLTDRAEHRVRAADRAVEVLRVGLDRLRWQAWRAVGIS